MNEERLNLKDRFAIDGKEYILSTVALPISNMITDKTFRIAPFEIMLPVLMKTAVQIGMTSTANNIIGQKMQRQDIKNWSKRPETVLSFGRKSND